MLDHVPIRIWLLLAIVVIAYTPANNLFRFSARWLPNNDASESAEEFDRRTSIGFARNLTALIALVAFAAFIFTPAATLFAHSPAFGPILLVASGAWALFSVVSGAITGSIEPFVRGGLGPFGRATEPKRFWASIIWNAAFCALSFWLAYTMTATGR